MKHYSILLFMLFVLCASSLTTTKAQVDVNDSLALVDLYNSTNGQGWINHNNWLTTAPVSTWYGVTMTNTNVTKLDLHTNWLIGTIPFSIGNLTNLQLLDLHDNQLSGSLPASIGNLVQLQTLHLTSNQLSGSIPSSIGNLVNLVDLLLNYNQLSGSIPASIGNLVKLTGLILYNNQLSGPIPSTIGNLVQLVFLDLFNNQLSGPIPSTIGNLVQLVFLSLNNNQLSGAIPSTIGNLGNLINLSLNDNQLSGEIPHTFKKLKKLTIIDLSYNQLSQNNNIRKSFGEPTYLINGRIDNNLFTFNGLEFVAKKFRLVRYDPQATIPVHQSGNVLSVYAGGTLSKNTYNWYQIGAAGSTVITGDSTFTPIQDGKYYVKVTNAIANQLTLYSDTIDFTMSSSITANNTLSANTSQSTVKQLFQVFPNPAGSIVNVRGNGTATIILTNSAGKVMLTKAINNTGTLNVSALANGVYYIQNKTTGEVQKVVVSH